MLRQVISTTSGYAVGRPLAATQCGSRAFDGTVWGNWDTFTLNTLANNPPVATIANQFLQTNEWAQVQSWLSYSDADGDPATQYQFWDGNGAAASGYFWTAGNALQLANQPISVDANDLSNVWVRGGSATGSDTMWVRANDGISWGSWRQFTLTTTP